MPRAGRRMGGPALYVAVLASIAALGSYAAHNAVGALIQKLNAVVAETADLGARAPDIPPPVVEKRVVLNEEWKDIIRSETFWRSRGSSGSPSVPSNARSARSAPIKAAPPRTAVPKRPAPAPQRTAAMQLGGPASAANQSSGAAYSAGGTFRTLCVRLCDGYYWPISFTTTNASFARDSAACEKSCGSPARLFVYKNPGGDPDDMEDLRGRPYKLLK